MSYRYTRPLYVMEAIDNGDQICLKFYIPDDKNPKEIYYEYVPKSFAADDGGDTSTRSH